MMKKAVGMNLEIRNPNLALLASALCVCGSPRKEESGPGLSWECPVYYQ